METQKCGSQQVEGGRERALQEKVAQSGHRRRRWKEDRRWGVRGLPWVSVHSAVSWPHLQMSGGQHAMLGPAAILSSDIQVQSLPDHPGGLGGLHSWTPWMGR